MSSLLPEFLQSRAPEMTFLRHMAQKIDRARQEKTGRTLAGGIVRPAAFRPLLLGYNGAANTGADVRVIEMLRQFNRIFAHVPFEPVLLASGTHFDHAQFQPVRKLHGTSYFPDFLSESMHACTGVIACEGSMFTSTFSDCLTGMFAGGMGHAAALGHLSVGYGAEAASMNASVEKFIASACKESLIIARNGDSLKKLQTLGLRTRPGADPAWTFEPGDRTDSAMLRRAGWNGVAPVAVLCPINPFCWPLVIDIDRAATAITTGVNEARQHDAISFHTWSDEAAGKYASYLTGFAELVRWLRQTGYFPVLVGMQDLDRSSCEGLNALLDAALPAFVRGRYGIDELTGLLHRAALIVSSRYHATVIGMAAGTPCIGVSMDSRIDSLFAENGLDEWLVPCHAERLGTLLIERASNAAKKAEALADRYGLLAARQIRAFGQMGRDVMAEAVATYADFPPSPLADSWDAHLPPLSARVEKLLCRYSADATVQHCAQHHAAPT